MNSLEDDDDIQADLTGCTWRCIAIVDAEWLVKYFFNSQFYSVLFCDRGNIWQERLTARDVVKRSKEINPSFEIDAPTLRDHIRDGLAGSHADAEFYLEHTSAAARSSLTVVMAYRLSGLPFCWKFHLTSVSADVVRVHLTEPLMAMVSELTRQRTQLFTLLKNKDKELADLKAQGATVSRKRFETPVFDEATFSSQLKNSLESSRTVCQSAFNDSGQQLYCDVVKSINRLQQNQSPSPLPAGSNTKSPSSSASSSPVKKSPDSLSAKQAELQRRAALEKRLAEEEKGEQTKKKKKIKF